jgi:acyl carrier protein
MSDASDSAREKLQTVFRNVFSDDELVLRDSMTAADVDGWDSLAHINIIIAVEKYFGIRFATAEISGLKGDGQNIGTFLQLIEKKRGAKR